MDAAFNLATCEKRCSVVASTASCWKVTTDDPGDDERSLVIPRGSMGIPVGHVGVASNFQLVSPVGMLVQ